MGRGKGSLTTRGDSYVIDLYHQGERFRSTIPGLSTSKKAHKSTAENILLRIQADLSQDKFNLNDYFPHHPKAKRFQKASDITIKSALEDWLNRKSRVLEISTLRDYKSSINYHLIPAFGEFSLTDLTTGLIRTWISNLDISNKRINNVLIPLRAIYSEAFYDEIIDRNPLDRIKNLPKQSTEVEPFTFEEMNLILEACEGQIKNIFTFAFWTGLRTSELIALKWEDINLKDGLAHIRNVRTRTGDKDHPKTSSSIRQIELLPPAKNALLLQKKHTGDKGDIFLDPQTNLPWKHDGPLRKTGWKNALVKAGVKYKKPYCTRHTFASLVLSSGANPMWVAKQLGHKDWGMLRKVYGRYIVDVDTSVRSKISSLWSPDGHKGELNA